MQGFIEFIRKQGVVGLAVGLVLGGAISKFVTAVIEDVVSPLLGLILGGTRNLATFSYTIPGTEATIKWGDLVVKGIDFVVIALIIYYVVMGFGLDKWDKKKS